MWYINVISYNDLQKYQIKQIASDVNQKKNYLYIKNHTKLCYLFDWEWKPLVTKCCSENINYSFKPTTLTAPMPPQYIVYILQTLSASPFEIQFRFLLGPENDLQIFLRFQNLYPRQPMRQSIDGFWLRFVSFRAHGCLLCI